VRLAKVKRKVGEKLSFSNITKLAKVDGYGT
jgi:hypothetical protein